ncbi:MAG: PilT/PilU family type 4a pilus ATPase [Chromatiales bacterium]|nr:PilT/PilU family type 4a pilus ATPase [Chromatiales bacterium]
MNLDFYLKLMVDRGAADLFFSAGAAPHLKGDEGMEPVGDAPFDSERIRELAESLMDVRQIERFERDLEMNLALERAGIGRFRVNVFLQRGQVSIVIRHVRDHIPSVQQLNLPAYFHQLVLAPRGLILVIGSTGCGKSTTLASMLDHRAASACSHILTVEDPIEYVHDHKRSVVDQREIGFDTLSYANALKNAMRESPDVILVGEIRDSETMQTVLSFAQTGHLVLSTLHASNVAQALQRIVSFYPEEAHERVLRDLSTTMVALIAQRLIPHRGGGRIPAIEVMTPTPRLRKLVEQGDIEAIPRAMEEERNAQVQTMDQSLYAMFRRGLITEEEALRNADSGSDLALRIRLTGAGPAQFGAG